MKTPKGTRRISWQRVLLSVLCVFLALVLTVMIAGTAYVNHLLSYVTGGDDSIINATLSPEQLATATSDPDYDPNFTGPSTESVPQVTVPNVQNDEDIINILLIGEDRKGESTRQRSDAMILCSFNTKTKTLTMISFLRDIYISEIPGYWSDKLNAAYQYGGAKTLNQTLAAYFGVHVDANVAVQFDGFVGIIDMLGGVDIELTQKEADHLNNIEPTLKWNLTKGVNHLTGIQALTYSRTRIIDMDAKRAERQRKVLTALLNTYKSKSLPEMLTLTSEILQTGFIQTDMSAEQIADYTRELFPILSDLTINNQQIPVEGSYESMKVGWVVDAKVCDLERNRKILQEILG